MTAAPGAALLVLLYSLGRTESASVSDWASVVVAVLALFLTVWQGWLARDHNRKSVTPHISIRHALGGPPDEKIGIEIRNTGIGPAVIKDVSFTINGKTFDACRRELFDALREAGLNQDSYSLAGVAPDDVVAAGDTFWPFAMFENKDKAEAHKAKVAAIGVVVKYASLYGEARTANKEPLDWDRFLQDAHAGPIE